MPISRKEAREIERIDRELNPEHYEHNTKVCSKCEDDLPLVKFYPGRPHCIPCDQSQKVQFRQTNPELMMWRAARYRAKRDQREFSISVEDIKNIWTDTCPIYQIPLKMNQGTPGPDSYSLDRIDNSKGYVPGNIAIVSNLFNMEKGRLTPEILRRMLAYIEGRLIF